MRHDPERIAERRKVTNTNHSLLPLGHPLGQDAHPKPGSDHIQHHQKGIGQGLKPLWRHAQPDPLQSQPKLWPAVEANDVGLGHIPHQPRSNVMLDLRGIVPRGIEIRALIPEFAGNEIEFTRAKRPKHCRPRSWLPHCSPLMPMAMTSG